MADIVRRFEKNPVLSPSDVAPSHKDLQVAGVLNPGVFTVGNKTGLLLRVAEWPEQSPHAIRTPVINQSRKEGFSILEFSRQDPALVFDDPRIVSHKGISYLTTLSHLRLAWSSDGSTFVVEPRPALSGQTALETFGLEDCRVSLIANRYWCAFTQVSAFGVSVGLASTVDWKTFSEHVTMLPPHNKDCAIFPRKINDGYYCLHRPTGIVIGGNYIWISRSPDLRHWGEHRCIATTRPGMWDCAKVGAGGPPIETDEGWLVLYHGADQTDRYCMGALLLDRRDPGVVLGRTPEPFMEPTASYERQGFYGNVVFVTGQTVINEKKIRLYYGASDQFICMAECDIDAIIGRLVPV